MKVLIRRKIDVASNVIKIHCFKSIRSKVEQILKDTDYSSIHPVGVGGFMSKEYVAEIQSEKFTALLSDDGRLISIYDVISDTDGDFLGK